MTPRFPRCRALAPISTRTERVRRALYLLQVQACNAAQVQAALAAGQCSATARAATRRATKLLQPFGPEADGLINLATRKRCLISEITPEDAIRLGPFTFDKETA